MPGPRPCVTSLSLSLDKRPPNRPPQPTFRTCTINVQGLNTAQLMLQALQEKQNPEIIAITETKLNPKQTKSQWIRNFLPQYRIISSELPNVNPSKAGTILAIKKDFFALGHLLPRITPPHLQGYLTHTTINLPRSQPMETLSIYCPAHTPGDIFIRQQIYKYINDTKNNNPDSTLLVMGDFNATLPRR